MLPSLLLVVVVVGLIAVHEYGHFRTARAYGVPVAAFSIGFGRPLWHRVAASGIEYRIGWMLVGGYTKMKNADDLGLSARQRALAYDNQPVNHRAIIALAGPLANLFLAILIYWCVAVVGTHDNKPVLAAPPPQSPAAVAGFRAGDTIKAVEKVPMLGWRSVRVALVGHIVSGKPMTVRVRSRDGTIRVLTLDVKGISASTTKPALAAGLRLDKKQAIPIIARAGVLPAFLLALNDTRQMAMLTLRSIDQYIFGRITTDPSQHPRAASANPVTTTSSAAANGWAGLLGFIAFLSIDLAMINCLPLPLLDGGQIILLYGEAALGRRLPRRARHAWSVTGIAVIFAVALAAIYGL